MNIKNEPHPGSSSVPVQRYFVREMAMVHRMFRREFLLAPALVRRVNVEDARRVHTVATHLRFISTTLHQHHSDEDRYAWPLLKPRAPAKLCAHVAAVTGQHRRVDALQAQFDAQLRAWSGGASVESTERLASALEQLTDMLVEHMDYEERHVVPLMETHISLDEWDQIVQTMMASSDRKHGDVLLVLGMTMYEGDKDIIAHTLARMHPNERAGIRLAAALSYTEHALDVHGTPAPPRSTEIRR
jgi:hemerythrin-like domain-containing protein